ncbi:hypothetical protein CSQ96_07615 [Janthinobacterium sp. BJB412]|nr:hypothetical protein CSQ96_07615 [Janthinobacterium sp. BJB412]
MICHAIFWGVITILPQAENIADRLTSALAILLIVRATLSKDLFAGGGNKLPFAFAQRRMDK